MDEQARAVVAGVFQSQADDYGEARDRLRSLAMEQAQSDRAITDIMWSELNQAATRCDQRRRDCLQLVNRLRQERGER